MIHARVKLSWAPSAVTAAIRREVKAAVRKGGERVWRETKQNALNQSGIGVVSKSGLNRGTIGDRIARRTQLAGLQKVVSTRLQKRKVLQFGGSYTYGKGKNQKTLNRVYWYGEPLHRWVQSSQPGTPPHKQFGQLQRSMAVQPINEGYRVKVGPGQNLKYARIHELGGKGLIRLPARPYLQPSFQKMLPAIMQDFRVAIAKATS